MHWIIKILLFAVGVEYAIIGFLILSAMSITQEINIVVVLVGLSFVGGINLALVIIITTVPKFFLKLLCNYIKKVVGEMEKE